MRECYIAWNIIAVVLLIDRLTGEPVHPLWPGFFILVAAAIGIAVLWEQPRRKAIETHNRRAAAVDPYVD